MGGARVGLEEARHTDGVLLLLLHPDVHRLDASKQKPGVEGAQAGTLRILEEVDLARHQYRIGKWRQAHEVSRSFIHAGRVEWGGGVLPRFGTTAVALKKLKICQLGVFAMMTIAILLYYTNNAILNYYYCIIIKAKNGTVVVRVLPIMYKYEKYYVYC